MSEEKKSTGALSIRSGIEQPSGVNPEAAKYLGKKRGKLLPAREYISGILAGDRSMLARAITLVESSNPKHFDLAQEIIENCLRHSGNSVRIGITGIPGAGKSTFIETFGKMLTGEGKQVAVLAIDPSSERSGGSILGDKTRMSRLSTDPNAFIRPSPTAGTLGGVARKTRESIIICEAAGYDIILIETVGVGQSETTVASMVDFFVLLLVAGAGDELQGIKRGIMEMADMVVVTKADGDNKFRAEKTATEFRQALACFPLPPSGLRPHVATCSSKEGAGIGGIWQTVNDYLTHAKASGYFEKKRQEQSVIRMYDFIADYLESIFYGTEEIKASLGSMEEMLRKGEITSYKAASILLRKFLDK